MPPDPAAAPGKACWLPSLLAAIALGLNRDGALVYTISPPLSPSSTGPLLQDSGNGFPIRDFHRPLERFVVILFGHHNRLDLQAG